MCFLLMETCHLRAFCSPPRPAPRQGFSSARATSLIAWRKPTNTCLNWRQGEPRLEKRTRLSPHRDMLMQHGKLRGRRLQSNRMKRCHPRFYRGQSHGPRELVAAAAATTMPTSVNSRLTMARTTTRMKTTLRIRRWSTRRRQRRRTRMEVPSTRRRRT